MIIKILNRKEKNLKVYISGPIEKNKNCREEFGCISYLLKRNGHNSVNPVQIMDPVIGVLSYDIMSKANLELLYGCDAIIFMPNWEKSKSCENEHDIALKLGLKVFYADTISKLPDDLIKQEESNVVYKRD